jgi:predicted phosphodiesterase
MPSKANLAIATAPTKRGGKQPRIDDGTILKVLDLKKDGWAERDIATVARISRGGVRGILARHGQINFFKKETADKVAALRAGGLTAEEVALKMGMSVRSVHTVNYYAGAAEKFEAAPNPMSHVVGARRAIGRRWKPGRYMVVCDLHVLFHNEEVLQQCLSVRGDFDGCIIAGDLIDEYWASHFRKSGYISHRKEIVTATAIIELLVKRFGRVLYCMGNHEDRRWKQMLEATTPLASLAEEDAQRIYKAVEETRNWYYNGMPGVEVHNDWWVTLCNEKIVLSHPDRFVSVPGQAVKAVVEHFFNHRKPYRLEHPDAVLMGHTHRLDNLKHRLGIWTCELPCMCGILPYQAGSKASNSGSIDTGYFVLTTHRDGTLWFNESRVYLLESEKHTQETKHEKE